MAVMFAGASIYVVQRQYKKLARLYYPERKDNLGRRHYAFQVKRVGVWILCEKWVETKKDQYSMVKLASHT